MGQVPDHHRARGMGFLGDRLHVVHPARTVVDLGQHYSGHHLIGDGTCHVFRRMRAQLVSLIDRAHQALCHIEIRGEVALIGQDHASVRAHLQRGGQCLIHFDRERVSRGHRPGRRSNQICNPITDPCRQRDPVSSVPGPDQLLPPFRGDDLTGPCRGSLGQRAKRVTIEVDHPFGDVEEILAGKGHSLPLKCQSSGKSSTSSILRK